MATTEGQSAYTPTQVSTWLRGLLTVAWADGNFDSEEQELIADLIRTELAPNLVFDSPEPIDAASLAASLGKNNPLAENFLRTAVMVAIANGTYSSAEDEVLLEFCQALGLQTSVLSALRLTLDDAHTSLSSAATATPEALAAAHDLLRPVRHWLDDMEIKDPQLARFLCKLIPSQCPFERDVVLFGRKVVHIPPLCKLNPLYEQLVGLRFRALSYLADDCKEDVSVYYQ